jgi:hypothetical protein
MSVRISSENVTDIVEYAALGNSVAVRLVRAVLAAKNKKMDDNEAIDKVLEAVRLRTVEILEGKID